MPTTCGRYSRTTLGARLTFLGESISGSYAQVRSRITTDRRVEMIGTGVGAVGGRKPDEEVSAVPHRA